MRVLVFQRMNVITPSDHDRAEWRRMAADAWLHDRTYIAEKFKAYGKLESYEKLPEQDYDAIQTEYRAWLRYGFGSKGV